MNKREKKKIRLRYLKKIENALIQEKSKKKVAPNLDHIQLLEKLKNLVVTTDYQFFLYWKWMFPSDLSYQEDRVGVYYRYRYYTTERNSI
jgi:hypothetical protein